MIFRPAQGYLSIALPISIIPLAGNHSKVRTGYRSHIGNCVVATVDIGESLIERHVEHRKFVVIAEKTLQKCLIAESELAKVVIRAIYENKIRAIGNLKRCKIIIGAN